MGARDAYSEKEVHENLQRALLTHEAVLKCTLIPTSSKTDGYAVLAVRQAEKLFAEWYEDQ